MSRKPTKGYYVKGHFVAEGSELDLALKREVKGDDLISKTDLKRESNALQKLGEDLLDLRTDLMQQLLTQGHMPDLLHEALLAAKKITDFEGKRRQMQFVGKLMRKLDSQQVQAMRDALDVQHNGSAEETQLLHLAEAWRTRLLQDDSAMEAWQSSYPGTDSQQLRALVRQARKDGLPDKTAVSQGLHPRQGRAYRDIFQILRMHLLQSLQAQEERVYDPR
jgi:ribosome-associated protein